MKRRTYVITALILFVGLIGATLTYRIYEKNNPQIFKTNEQIQFESGVPVEVVVVSRRNIVSQEIFTGTIEGFSETQIISDITQKVIDLRVGIGSRVMRNDTVAILDKKSISGMNLKYDPTLMAYRDAKIELERMQNLFEAGAVTKQAFDKAKLNFEISKSNLEAITSAVFVTSPIKGIITETYVESGDKVNAGKPIAKVVRFDKVKIKVQVNESDIAKIKVGQKCRINTSSFEQIFEGKVSEVSLSANPITRNFEATVVVVNPDLLLRSGMFATVRIVFIEKERVLAVHKDAILKNDHKYFVYTVSNDSLISRNNITIGTFDGIYYEILSGLGDGEMVVIEGQNNIQNENQKAIIIAQE